MNRSLPWVACFALYGGAACGSDKPAACDQLEWGVAESPLYGGYDRPGLLSLSDAQRAAVTLVEPGLGPSGYFCTATHVANGWVLSAAHCLLGGGLFLHLDEDGKRIIAADDFILDQSHDVLLAHFPIPTDVNIEPLGLYQREIDDTWLGERVTLAGLGEQSDGSIRRLNFVVEEIVDMTAEHVVVSGHGRTGACLGDSGGPILVIGKDGRPRILGTLTSGAGSCLGIDNYVRADIIAAVAGDQIHPGETTLISTCELVPASGACQANTAIYCEGGEVVAEPCGSLKCVWHSTRQGFRCGIASDSPCTHFTALGGCANGRPTRCDAGRLLELDCSDCAAECGFDEFDGRASCVHASRRSAD